MGESKSPTRLECARVIRDAVLVQGKSQGGWKSVDLGDGRTARCCEIETDAWTATVTTRFSGLPREVVVETYEEALLHLALPRTDDVLIDVYHPEAGKVLSIGRTGEDDTLIGMQAGPWETGFGLPHRDWAPSVARRLASKVTG